MISKKQIWKYLTAFIVVLIILNPETVQLALFIDAVGLETFIMLLEIQFFTLLSVFFNTKIKPIWSYITSLYSQYHLLFSWENIKERPEILTVAVPDAARLMHLLVFITAIGVLYNVY